MKDKKKIIICAVVAVAILLIGIVAGVFIRKENTDKNTDIINSTTSTTTSTTSTTEELSSEFEEKNPQKANTDIPVSQVKAEGGVARGICSYKGTDYVATEEGFFMVTASGKQKLTSQSAGNYFSIIDDKIYYSVETRIVKEYYGDNSVDYINWQLCEGWVMNLDGSGQKKLLNFIGDGFIIYADDNVIYYAESPGPGLYTCGIGYYIYKYDLQTGKKIAIDRGEVTYELEDGSSEIWYKSVDNIIYHNGSIYYKNYTCDGSYVRAVKYDIATGKKTEFTDSCRQIYLAQDGTIYLTYGVQIDVGDGYIHNLHLACYSPDENKVYKILPFDVDGVSIFDSAGGSIYISITDYEKGSSILGAYNRTEGYKEVAKFESTEVDFIDYDSETGKILYIDYSSDENSISGNTSVNEMQNGKVKVIKEGKDYGGYLTVTGEYCALIDIYDSEQSSAENDYYTEELIILK